MSFIKVNDTEHKQHTFDLFINVDICSFITVQGILCDCLIVVDHTHNISSFLCSTHAISWIAIHQTKVNHYID